MTELLATSPIPFFNERVTRLTAIRERLLSLASNVGTPLYVYDEFEAQNNVREFQQAFSDAGCPISIFYAIKSNPHLGLLKTVVNEGGFLDASSPSELDAAIEAGASKIVYTGPAKSEKDLLRILDLESKLFLHLDSLHELATLGSLLQARCRDKSQPYRCGIRVYGSGQSGWSKFGIPLSELREFLDEAKKYPELQIAAIQFHVSFNRDASRYVATIQEIGEFLAAEENEAFCNELEILDIGGGYSPPAFEGIYPWNPSMEIRLGYDEGLLQKIIGDQFSPRILPISYTPISSIASDIADALKENILCHTPNVTIWSEPGRFISHSTIHMLLSIADVKPSRDAIITDGGNNMVGYEKHQWQDYTPIFNLTHYSTSSETPVLCYGSLCTAHDLWGYYLYGTKNEIGDVLVVPYQGAYTNTLSQHFIRHIPQIVPLSEGLE